LGHHKWKCHNCGDGYGNQNQYDPECFDHLVVVPSNQVRLPRSSQRFLAFV
jgi:hypothetical protein